MRCSVQELNEEPLNADPLATSFQLWKAALHVLCPACLCTTHAASKGNKIESSGPLVFSFLLGSPLIAMYVYFIAFQTYV
jgi:hypothetical protein